MKYPQLLDDKYKVEAGQFFNFETVGQMLEGVFIGSQENTRSKYGEQLVHKIKTDDGLMLLGGCKILDDRFSTMREGQIVIVKWEGKKKTKDGKGEYHDYVVYSDPKLVDQNYINSQEEVETAVAFGDDSEMKEIFGSTSNQGKPPVNNDVPFEGGNFQNGSPTPSVVTGNATTSEPLPTTDKRALLVDLAKKKFDLADEGQALEKLMNESGLAVIEKNFDTLIDLLQ